jgi:hypothetical protein
VKDTANTGAHTGSAPRPYRPGEWALSAEVTPQSAQAKSAALGELIPDRDRYLLIPAARYRDAGFAEHEWQGVWSKVWTCAGRASDLSQTGQWIRYDLGRESFIIVRQRDGEIKAFYNVCQHRGRVATPSNPQLGDLLEQDLANLPAIQQGLLLNGIRNGVRLSELEQRIQQLHAEIDRRIASLPCAR